MNRECNYIYYHITHIDHSSYILEMNFITKSLTIASYKQPNVILRSVILSVRSFKSISHIDRKFQIVNHRLQSANIVDHRMYISTLRQNNMNNNTSKFSKEDIMQIEHEVKYINSQLHALQGRLEDINDQLKKTNRLLVVVCIILLLTFIIPYFVNYNIIISL